MAKSTFKKTILKVTGIGVALGLVIILFMYYANYSEGYRAGVPMKISKKGVVFKTHEGQLNIGGLSNNAEGVIPSTWEFSVLSSDPVVLTELDVAIESSKRVKLFYVEKYGKLFWRGDTKYFVTKVEILD